MQFIETIYKILKPGGIWINLGPLLYHFSDLPNEDSIEPSYDAIRDVIFGFGFQLEVRINSLYTLYLLQVFTAIFMFVYFFQKEKTHVKTRYAQNSNSMLQCEYNSVYFVCRKPHEHSDNMNHKNVESNGTLEQEN